MARCLGLPSFALALLNTGCTSGEASGVLSTLATDFTRQLAAERIVNPIGVPLDADSAGSDASRNCPDGKPAPTRSLTVR